MPIETDTDLGHLVENGFADAQTYDTYRPYYPAESVTRMLDKLDIIDIAGSRILDLGAGTGKLTEQLVLHDRSYEIIAVEPHGHMRRVLESKGLKDVKVVNGTANNLVGVEGGWADGVVVAQAFHWFDNLETLKEIHRVLKLNGTLALIWNFEDYHSGLEHESTTPWENHLKQLLRPNKNHRKWQDVFQQPPSKSLFSPLEGDICRWTVWLTKDAIWDRFRTCSLIAVQGGEELQRTKRFFDDVMAGEDVEVNEDGEVALHGRTELFWTTALEVGHDGGI